LLLFRFLILLFYLFWWINWDQDGIMIAPDLRAYKQRKTKKQISSLLQLGLPNCFRISPMPRVPFFPMGPFRSSLDHIHIHMHRLLDL